MVDVFPQITLYRTSMVSNFVIAESVGTTSYITFVMFIVKSSEDSRPTSISPKSQCASILGLSKRFPEDIHQAHHNEQQPYSLSPAFPGIRRRHARRLLAPILDIGWTQTRQPALRIAQGAIEICGMIGE